MENCTIYSHTPDFESLAKTIRLALPNAEIHEGTWAEGQYLSARLKGGWFGKEKSLRLSYRQRARPSYELKSIECPLTRNLSGMVNYIRTIPAQNNDIQSRLLYKVMAANAEIAFMAEPEMQPEFEKILFAILEKQDAFVFVQPSNYFKRSNTQYFADKHLKLILDQNGRSEVQELSVKVDAKYHDPSPESLTQEQIDRKAKSEFHLRQLGIKYNNNLPCIPGSHETGWVHVEEALERAYCLMVVAVKGEGIESSALQRVIEEKNINGFSPIETAWLEQEGLQGQEKAEATWRYESFYALLWALSLVPELSPPSQICPVQEIVGLLVQNSRADIEARAQWRSKSEILDQLDLIYRMHWAIVDARIHGQPTPGNMEPGVVLERHYVLNWVTQRYPSDWDHVPTPT